MKIIIEHAEWRLLKDPHNHKPVQVDFCIEHRYCHWDKAYGTNGRVFMWGVHICHKCKKQIPEGLIAVRDLANM